MFHNIPKITENEKIFEEVDLVNLKNKMPTLDELPAFQSSSHYMTKEGREQL